MDTKFIKTEQEREYFPLLEEMSDRELHELHAYYLSNINKTNKKIDNNIRFFFWLTLASIAIGILISFNS